MKENRYDDDTFFAKYSDMPRSKGGLEAAGEWHELRRLLPNFAGKRVLDLGCGFGWHCIYAAEQGAAKVVGIDISEKMLAVAREKTGALPVEYLQLPIEDATFPAGSFDVVISSLAFHYIEDFAAICKKVFSFLAPGGSFVFSAEHPVFTAYGNQDWYYGENGEILHWPVDNYFSQGQRRAVFLGEEMVKYHRTLAGYLEAVLAAGFAIEHVVEPMPPKAMLDAYPEAKDELRRPMFLLVGAHKPA